MGLSSLYSKDSWGFMAREQNEGSRKVSEDGALLRDPRGREIFAKQT